MPSTPRQGRSSVGVQIRVAILSAVEEHMRERKLDFITVIHQSLRRHLLYPPPIAPIEGGRKSKRLGTIFRSIEIETELRAAVVADAKARSTTFVAVLEAALERHLADPPPDPNTFPFRDRGRVTHRTPPP
jgi:hypothetical protein